MTKVIETSIPEKVESVDTGKAVVAFKPGYFPGAFGRFQTAAFGQLFHAGLSKQVAHKVAQDYGADLGNAIRNGDDSLRTKVAKANKNGDTKITISGGGKTATSRSMSVIRVAQVIEGLYYEGLINSRKMPELNAEGTHSLADYISECEAWAVEQTWATEKA